MKFAVGLWAYGKTGDRFLLEGYKDDIPLPERISMVSKNRDISAVELNCPSDVNEENALDVRDILRGEGLEAAMVGVDLSGERTWRYGSLSATDPAVREGARRYCLRTVEAARSLNCDRINVWLGQDGFDYCFQSDYPAAWSRLVESVASLAASAPDLKICVEYKPKEPRTHCFIDSASKALLLSLETSSQNVGVTIDVGHSFNAGENVAEAACLLGDKLFHLHLNDNYRSWDDDLIVGSVHTVEFLELLYWLRRQNYEGYYSLDLFPYREDATRAVDESIAFLKSASAVLDRIGTDKIPEAMQKQDVVETLSLVRKSLFADER